MLKLTGIAIAACAAVAALTLPAAALPVTWTLHNAGFVDGGTASGSYVYDADTNTLSSVNITTTAGTLFGGATYTLVDPGFGPAPDFAVVVTGVLGDYTGTPALAFGFFTPMTNAGGSLLLGQLGEFACIDAGCTNGSLIRTGVSGFVTATGVPEPATLALFGGALLGFGAVRRRLLK